LERIARIDGARIIVNAIGDRGVGASFLRIASINGAKIVVVASSVDIDWFQVTSLVEWVAFNGVTFVSSNILGAIYSAPYARSVDGTVVNGTQVVVITVGGVFTLFLRWALSGLSSFAETSGRNARSVEASGVLR